MANWNQVVIDLDNAILHEEKIIQRANEFIIVFVFIKYRDHFEEPMMGGNYFDTV